MEQERTYRDDYIAAWHFIRRHGPIVGSLGGAVVLFMYNIGFVSIPATKPDLDALGSRVTRLESQSDGLSGQMHEIEIQSARSVQKMDDVKDDVSEMKRSIDRLSEIMSNNSFPETRIRR